MSRCIGIFKGNEDLVPFSGSPSYLGSQLPGVYCINTKQETASSHGISKGELHTCTPPLSSFPAMPSTSSIINAWRPVEVSFFPGEQNIGTHCHLP